MFFPDREHLRGFFEHAEGLLPWFAWAWVSLRWAVLPWVFWRKVTLYIKPVPRRMVLWPVVTTGTIWLLGVLTQLSVTLYMLLVNPATPASAAGAADLGMWVFNIAADPFVRYDDWGGMRWAANRPALTWDPRGYLRAAAPFVAFCLAWPAVFMALGETMRRCRVRRAHVWRAGVYSLAWLPALALLLLADKVHAILFDLGAGVGGWRVTYRSPTDVLRPFRGWLAGGLAGWVWLWWLLAIRRAFGLSHALAVWMLLGIAAGLAGFIVHYGRFALAALLR